MQAGLHVEQLRQGAQALLAAGREFARIGGGFDQAPRHRVQLVEALELERVHHRLARGAAHAGTAHAADIDQRFEFAGELLQIQVLPRHRLHMVIGLAQLLLDLRVGDHRLADQAQQFIDQRRRHAQHGLRRAGGGGLCGGAFSGGFVR
jgi:hypothetical protein